MAWHGVDETPDTELTALSVDGVDVLLIRLGDEWHAVEDRCSHAGCAFSTDGELDGSTLICDCHGSEFDVRSGEPLVMPAREAIRTFAVRRAGDGTLEFEL